MTSRPNSVEDLRPIAGFDKLIELSISNNKVNSFSDMRDLLRLEYLDARKNEIADLQYIDRLRRLNEVDLGANNIVDIFPVLSISNLSEIDLRENPLSDQSRDEWIPRLEERNVRVLVE